METFEEQNLKALAWATDRVDKVFAAARERPAPITADTGNGVKDITPKVDRTAEAADSLRRCQAALDDALYRTPSDPCGQIQAAMDHLENYVECMGDRR